MSNKTATTADPAKVITDAVAAAVAPLKTELEGVRKDLTEVREKAAKIDAPRVGPYGIVGPLGKDSEPYSFARMAAVAMGYLAPEEAKYELDVSARLKGLYGNRFTFHRTGQSSWLVPAIAQDVAHWAGRESDAEARWAGEMQLRVKGWQAGAYDPQEAVSRGVTREKALNTLADTQGGVLRGFPTLGEIIDFRRNLEVFARAGAREVSLPPNGLMNFPKQVGATVAYYAGEAAALSPESETKFGQLELKAKKMFIRTTLTNDLLRFVTPSAETIVRSDMANVGRRRFDRAQLYGVENSTGVRGIVTYGRPVTPLTQWEEGLDWLIQYTAGVVAANGDTLQPEDVFRMTSRINDEAQESDNLTFVGRFDLYAALAARRAGSGFADNDGKGAFLFNMMREIGDRQQMAINGHRYVGSSQVPKDRVKGAGADLTLLLAGDFSEWITARFGVMEFLATNVSDSAFDNDTTKLRCIEYHDAGPRTASSFVLVDQLLRA